MDSSTMSDQTAAAQDPLERLVRVDLGWFVRFHPSAAIALKDGLQSFDEYFLRYGLDGGLQLLAAFSTPLDGLYRAIRQSEVVTVADVVENTITAAASGIVSHWLFSLGHYRSILEWRGDAEREGAPVPEEVLYLDFLVRGDAAGHNPHPLFCHAAYRKLNGSRVPATEKCFEHYLFGGSFDSLRTSAIFDAEFYLASNPRARSSLTMGRHASALHHFLAVGIFEDAPFCPDFDLQHYGNAHPDVRQAATEGRMPSLTWHFVYHGLEESKEPNPYFHPAYYRTRQPQVVDEMRRLGIRSELEHFLLIGKARGYKTAAVPPASLDAAKAVFLRRARRSFDNVLRRPPDFSSFLAGTPVLSVVVPVYNEVEFTSRFIECAYFAAAHFHHLTGLACEVIVVDNGSSDATGPTLAACQGLRVLSFDEPIGFPRAVNAGVRASTGDIVIVANNDLEFNPDSFLKVWNRLRTDPSIGVLGGLTLLPNESLQEAGSFLDSTGGVTGLGRLEDPWDEFYQGVHEADYSTGSFISFRRRDYDALGGLAEEFSPGYYEETDFAFRMREKLGKPAAVDSSIQVTHFEHASFSKGRPPTTAYALIKKNQSRFVARHQQALQQRPALSQLVTEAGIRPKAVGRTRFLIIEDMVPDTRLGSGFVRSSQVLAALSRHHIAFDLLALNPHLLVEDYADHRVKVFRAWLPGEDAETVLTRYAARYSHVMVCRLHNLERLATLLETLRSKYDFQVICDTEAVSVLRTLEFKAMSGHRVTDADRTAAVREELGSPVRVSHWVAVSPYEKRKIEDAGFGPVTVVSHDLGVSLVAQDRPWAERKRILAVGAVHEAGSPNHDGLFWFMDRIYPKCKQALSGLQLTIVGYWAPDVLRAFRDRYAQVPFVFLGTVSDAQLNSLYDESRMTLAPTRFAAGVACKVLESMMRGVPSVITDLLEEQIVGEGAPGSSGLAVGVRNDGGESFAKWVATLATNAKQWEAVRQIQYRHAKPLGDREAFDAGITQLLERCDAIGAAHASRPHRAELR
jgi:O-antigen biosynthesis protein